MNLKVLSPAQLEQFVEDGFVHVQHVFSAETAAACREALWQKIGLSPDNPAGWSKPLIQLQKSFDEPPFGDAFTPKFHGLCDDVMGEGRWNPVTHLGWWPISFPGFETAPWHEPEVGWHVDGQQFHHHVNSPDQGLLPIFILSEIGPGDGGTALSVGSHKITARVLADAEPEGLDAHELARRVASYPRPHVIEANGEPGDVILMHPFMLHARSMNTGNKVRFICNPCVSLREPMNLNRDYQAEYSPVERAIVNALSTTPAGC
jgi:hypothetical protein